MRKPEHKPHSYQGCRARMSAQSPRSEPPHEAASQLTYWRSVRRYWPVFEKQLLSSTERAWLQVSWVNSSRVGETPGAVHRCVAKEKGRCHPWFGGNFGGQGVGPANSSYKAGGLVFLEQPQGCSTHLIIIVAIAASNMKLFTMCQVLLGDCAISTLSALTSTLRGW